MIKDNMMKVILDNS